MRDSTSQEPVERSWAATPDRVFQRWHPLQPTALAMLALLFAVALVRWYPDLTLLQPRLDETYYLEAFERVSEGQSPYLVREFLYPPAFALAGAWLLERMPEYSLLLLLRSLSLLELCLMVWIALAWLPAAWWQRLVLGAAVLCLSPAVTLGVRSGNISFAICGLGICALLAWPHRPLAAGSLLAMGIAVKPLLPAALVALATHRPLAGGRKHWLAAGWGGLLAALLLLLPPYLSEMMASAETGVSSSRPVSLHRVLVTAGLPFSPTLVALLVFCVTVLVVRRRPLAPVQLLCVALSAACLASPILWSHSLLMTLPIQTLALTLALQRVLRVPRTEDEGVGPSGGTVQKLAVTRQGIYELLLVLAGIAALHFSDGVDGAHGLNTPIRLLVTALPVLAPAGLTAYILRRSSPF